MSMLLSAVLSASMFAPEPAPRAASQPASDQDADDAAMVREDSDGRWYVFGEDELTGEVLTPDGDLIPWRRPAKFGSLITIRPHFNRELLKLVLDLR